jgi:hypothetical protein
MTSTVFLDRIFQFASVVALLSWLAVFLIPGWVLEHLAWMVLPVGLLCAVYLFTVVMGGRFDAPGTSPRGHFRSMKGVLGLFKSPRVVLAGWVHFLAFDLLVGLMILSDSASQGIGHLWILPSLLLTLMFGPIGLLSYLAVRLMLG